MEDALHSPPTYRIFRDKHGIPQFEPRRGTQALKDALAYSFPTMETELELMQAALSKFFNSERGIQFIYELPENDLQASLAKKKDLAVSSAFSWKPSFKTSPVLLAPRPRPGRSSRTSSRASSRASSTVSSRAETPSRIPDAVVEDRSGGTMTTWVLSNGQELGKKKKQPYDPVKRRKVAENRGNVCEKHRASKTACDPYNCPQNKLYSQLRDDSQHETGDSSGDAQSDFFGSKYAAQDDPSGIQASNLENSADPLSCTVIHTKGGTSEVEADVAWDAPLPHESFVRLRHTSSIADGELIDSRSGPHAHRLSVLHLLQELPSNHDMGQGVTVRSEEFGLVVGSKDTNDLPSPAFQNPIPFNNEGYQLDRTEQVPQIHTVSLPEELGQQFQPYAVPAEKGSECSGDPFMGWASKRASQIFEDYGWVLSHVETL